MSYQLQGLQKPMKAYIPEKGVPWYVSDLPGQGGVDWGYDVRPEKATVLAPYWQRRFQKHCDDINRRPIFVPVD